MKLKQVIVMRNDLNMRKGKMVAQGAHASMEFIRQCQGKLSSIQQEWMDSAEHAKVCVQVGSEDELWSIRDRAEDAGIEVCVVTDFGLTEFNGVHTKTCIALGPDDATKIDAITGHLKLL